MDTIEKLLAVETRNRRQKRALSLLEIMIVIFLITLITGVVGYNMKGSLDKGKIFRSRQAKEQLHDMLLLLVSEGKKPDDLIKNPLAFLEDLGLAKNPKKLLVDGWGAPFSIKLAQGKKDFLITSENSARYDEKE